MCYEGKCLFFIPVRKGSLIFGYILALISGLGICTPVQPCTGVDIFFSIKMIFPKNYCDYSNRDRYFNEFVYETYAIIITIGYLVEFLSSFICSMLLVIGIKENKPKFVKTFLIYGMLQVVLFVCFIMVHCTTSVFYAGFLLLALALVGIYVMCLYMVFKSYQLMVITKGNDQVFMDPPVKTGSQLFTSSV